MNLFRIPQSELGFVRQKKRRGFLKAYRHQPLSTVSNWVWQSKWKMLITTSNLNIVSSPQWKSSLRSYKLHISVRLSASMRIWLKWVLSTWKLSWFFDDFVNFSDFVDRAIGISKQQLGSSLINNFHSFKTIRKKIAELFKNFSNHWDQLFAFWAHFLLFFYFSFLKHDTQYCRS